MPTLQRQRSQIRRSRVPRVVLTPCREPCREGLLSVSAIPTLMQNGEGNSGRKGGAEGRPWMHPESLSDREGRLAGRRDEEVKRRSGRARQELRRGRIRWRNLRAGFPGRRLPVGRVGVKRGECLRERVFRLRPGRKKPVPVKHGDITGDPRPGVPAEQMVVKLADLASLVVVADVVKVRLRQRGMHHAEGHEDDPQDATRPRESPTSNAHAHLVSS